MFAQMINGGDLVRLLTHGDIYGCLILQHNGIAQYYDLPVLTLRGPVLHAALANVSLVRELFVQKSQEEAEDLSDRDLRHVRVAALILCLADSMSSCPPAVTSCWQIWSTRTSTRSCVRWNDWKGHPARPILMSYTRFHHFLG
jgi:hypothetical protein